MTRADIVFWDVAMNMPITMEGVNDGMWAMILIIVVLWILLTPSKPRYIPPPDYPPYYPRRRPPNYPPYF